MFVKPSSAFVGKPSLVASSSGSAKKARYARLLPSTRKSSASRAGASFRSSSAPVRVLGDIRPSVFRPLLESAGAARPPSLGHPHRRRLGARRRARAATARAGPRDGRRGGDEGGAALSARRRAARGARRTGLPGDDRRRAAGAAAHQRAGRPATARDRGGERGARGARRADRSAGASHPLVPPPPLAPAEDRWPPPSRPVSPHPPTAVAA